MIVPDRSYDSAPAPVPRASWRASLLRWSRTLLAVVVVGVGISLWLLVDAPARWWARTGRPWLVAAGVLGCGPPTRWEPGAVCACDPIEVDCVAGFGEAEDYDDARFCASVVGDASEAWYETYADPPAIYPCAAPDDCVAAVEDLRCDLCGECWGSAGAGP